jgi:hypothetical protein
VCKLAFLLDGILQVLVRQFRVIQIKNNTAFSIETYVSIFHLIRRGMMKRLLFVLAISVLLLGVSALGWAGINDGLVAYYPFEDDATDVSGNGNNGVPSVGIIYTNGIVGQAASFDGSNYIDVQENTNLDGFNNFTLSLWVQPRTTLTAGTGRQDFLYKGIAVTGGAPWAVMYNDGNDGRITCSVVGQSDIILNGWTEYYTALTGGEWYHIAITYDGTDMVMYFNGNDEGTYVPRNLSGQIVDNANKLRIGARTDNRYFFDGAMDEVRIYNRTLTSDEIYKLYQQGLEPVEMLADLLNSVVSLNLQNGISNALDAKLDTAIAAISDINNNNDVAAVNSLSAFINSVQAQSGNKIAVEDADMLIAAAQAIIDKLTAE